jgi:hypothetical protein
MRKDHTEYIRAKLQVVSVRSEHINGWRHYASLDELVNDKKKNVEKTTLPIVK